MKIQVEGWYRAGKTEAVRFCSIQAVVEAMIQNREWLASTDILYVLFRDVETEGEIFGQ